MSRPEADRKTGWRRVLRRESEWSLVEWAGLALVIGVCFYLFDSTKARHESLGTAIVLGACSVGGILIGRSITERRRRRRAGTAD